MACDGVFEHRKRIGAVVIVRGGAASVAFGEHPSLRIVVQPLIGVGACSHGLKAVLLPTHPSSTAVEEGHVRTPKTQGFKGKRIGSDGIKFNVFPGCIAEVVG